MTKIKLCGLSRPEDVLAANGLAPDYIGFVFWRKSRRFVDYDTAIELKKLLDPKIQAVGVFVDEEPDTVNRLLNRNIIDLAQLHGGEDESYINRLRRLTDKPIIKAFRIKTESDIQSAMNSTADYILLDSGAGTGSMFDWELLRGVNRPYFLAGGLSPDNAALAVRSLHPYGVDVSSGIETDGLKDKIKMTAFVRAVRVEDIV
jgi:phosphoribosylanthranilate isomerase